jgi:heme-degrading monooxygenase HmoA
VAETLINVFIVEQQAEQAFLENWRKTTDVFRTMPGFIETHLHRNTGVGNATFQFINIARWTSAKAWRETHDAYQPTEYRIPGVRGHPAIFETIINVYSDSLAETDRAAHWIATEPSTASLEQRAQT